LVAEVRPQVSGIIQERHFEEGQDVNAGDVLYQIDPAPYKAAYDRAVAALAMAEADLPAIRSRVERYKNALATRAVSQQDYDDAVGALNQAEAAIEARRAELEKARIDLAYTPITAPISGRIGKSNVTPGALVIAYQPVPLATIQQLDPIYVDVPQSTAKLLQLTRTIEAQGATGGAAGQRKVRLLLEDGTPYPAEGTLQFRDVTVDPTTGCVTLRMVFPNPQCVLLPGMFVRAVVEEGVLEQAILVPQQAVTRDPKGNAIALVVNASGHVEQRTLQLDRAIADKWVVLSGLAPGDRVIVEGIQNVRPGVSAKVVDLTAARQSNPQASQAVEPANDGGR
jgi:membrane fusion protein (multidrug efflux system)